MTLVTKVGKEPNVHNAFVRHSVGASDNPLSPSKAIRGLVLSISSLSAVATPYPLTNTPDLTILLEGSRWLKSSWMSRVTGPERRGMKLEYFRFRAETN